MTPIQRGEGGKQSGESAIAVTQDIPWEPARGPWIVEVGSSEDTKRTLLRSGESLLLGTGKDVDLRVSDSCVSAHHCLIDARDSKLRVVDLGSKNGVYVGTARVREANLAARAAGFVIGRTSVVIKVKGGASPDCRGNSIAGLVGASDSMMRVAQQIRRFASLRAPVLIVGESGTGKDVVARALHGLSGRTGLLVPLNVAAIPETLADSELFGHVRGAFTGATSARPGAFELARGGTLFLDEIGELSASIQAKLLRVLEDCVVRPVGSTQGTHVDVRVVSASWAPLAERAAGGTFRFDLFQRISTVVIEMPPLRRRRSDIPMLARMWLERFRGEVGSHSLSSAAMAQLVAYDWPGNVRELGSVLYRASVAAESPIIDVAEINLAFKASMTVRDRSPDNPLTILHDHGGNVSRAAKSAGVPRTTFRAWLARARAGNEGTSSNKELEERTS